MQSVNGAQFSNITPVFLLCNRFTASSAPASVLVIVPLTSISESLSIHKGDLNIEVLNLI